jgi:hypothetical protein
MTMPRPASPASAPPAIAPEYSLYEMPDGTFSVFTFSFTAQGEPRWHEMPGLDREKAEAIVSARQAQVAAQRERTLRAQPPQVLFVGPALNDRRNAIAIHSLMVTPEGDLRWERREETGPHLLPLILTMRAILQQDRPATAQMFVPETRGQVCPFGSDPIAVEA